MIHKYFNIKNGYRNPVAPPLGATRRLRFQPDYKIDKEEFDLLVKEVGDQGAAALTKKADELTVALNKKQEDVAKGLMSQQSFDDFKAKELKAINDFILKYEKIIEKQGEEINVLRAAPAQRVVKSLEDFLQNGSVIVEGEEKETKLIDRMKQVQRAGNGMIEIPASELIKAGVVNFGRRKAASINVVNTPGTVGGTNGSIVDMSGTLPGSPWLPGLGGTALEMFDIIYNPNFILNRVNVGSTNQPLLAWINEVEFAGTVSTNVAEGDEKPLIQHKWQVEFSRAKKAAAAMTMTEEFQDDVPQLATKLRNLLNVDVIRAFDDQIQSQVIAAAHPFEITGLDGGVPFTTLFDACGALLAQIGFYNFQPNTLALNTVTDWRMFMDKDADGRYLNPPFLDRLNRYLVEANKIAVGYGLAGDLLQYHVDIYKDFVIRVGWVNNQFRENKFTIIGELRYHSYISEARKKAIVYNQLNAVMQKITAGS
jgi:hypothetical protein